MNKTGRLDAPTSYTPCDSCDRYSKCASNFVSCKKFDRYVNTGSEAMRRKLLENDNLDGAKIYHMGGIKQYDRFGKLIGKFKSITEACNELKLNYDNIWRCCKGKQATSYGYVWRYDK